MLRQVLSECFLGTPRKCPGECPENWECPRECSQDCFSSLFPKEKCSWKHFLWHSQFSRHLGSLSGHFLGVPKSSPKAFARALTGIPHSPQSTPVNGRWQRNPMTPRPVAVCRRLMADTVLSWSQHMAAELLVQQLGGDQGSACFSAYICSVLFGAGCMGSAEEGIKQSLTSFGENTVRTLFEIF